MKISQIDDNLSIYKNNVVILLGIGNGTKQLIDLMRYHKIEIAYICDGGKNTTIEGITVINPAKLKQMLLITKKQKNSADIVVQISAQNMALGTEEQLNGIGVKKIISFEESFRVLRYLEKYNRIQECPQMMDAYRHNLDRLFAEDKCDFYDHLINNIGQKEHLVICSTPKTGDNTLINTFNTNRINHLFVHHSPQSIDLDLCKKYDQKIKVVTGLRDPIATHISGFYQMMGVLDHKHSSQLLEFLDDKSIFINGGDVQELFDTYITSHIHSNDFTDRFENNILAISQYPFDKEKGYTIFKEGNVEVFAYQLEKMNNAVKEMSEWIGANQFTEWVRGNEASGKWIANSYKQAQKEIKFSRDFFDKCYDDKWVQHFYSQEDIEKFKEKWKNNIID